jgi:hypothetical protein
MDFNIPLEISLIISEEDARNRNDINKAIQFLINILHKQNEFKEFQRKIEKLMKTSDKKKEELKFLKYLHEEFIKLQKEYEEKRKRNDERRKKEQEEKRKAEAKFQEKMRLRNLQSKLDSIDWDYIKLSLSDYIIADLNKLFQQINNSVLNTLTTENIEKSDKNYKQAIERIKGYFKDLWTNSVADFFKRNYDFKSESDLFKLEKLKDVIEKYDVLINSNQDISIELAENFLHAQQKENEAENIREKLNEANIEINAVNEYENIILAIKIAHTVFMKYIAELEKNFKELRKDFKNKNSVPDELIYFSLYVNNNYIDEARAFIKKKKNNNEEEYDNDEETTETSFSRAIYNIQSRRKKTEGEIIQEYDEQSNNLNEMQKNYILFHERYDVLEFISKCLNEDEYYNVLDDLYFNKNYIDNVLIIRNIELFMKYYKLLNCGPITLKKKYIKYKIFEQFIIKFRGGILSDFTDVYRLYNSYTDIQDMFIKLILGYDKFSNIDDIHIDLNVYLQIIACVIIKYYTKDSNMLSIIKEKITDPRDRALATNYITKLFEMFKSKNKINIGDEGYFKLFAKIRDTPSWAIRSYNVSEKEHKTKLQNIDQSTAADLQTRLEGRLHGVKNKFKKVLPPVLVKQAHKNSGKTNRAVIVNKKIKATDEDKFQIITKSFDDMDKEDSLFKPLLGFHDEITFEKNNEFAEINTIQELTKIYEKNKEILDVFFGLLYTLSKLINLTHKNEKDYYDIQKNLSNLIHVLEQLSNIFRTSISDHSEGEKITQLFNTIIRNIETNLVDKYDDEKSQKFKNKNKLTQAELNKYLKILEITIQDIYGKSFEEINKIINRQFRTLSKKTHSDKTGLTSNNKFSNLIQAKDKLRDFYIKQKSENNENNENNKNNEINYNTNEFRKFRKNYLQKNPHFMPVASSAQNYENRQDKIRSNYKKYLKSVNTNTTRKDLLNDIIIPRIIESIDIGNLNELTPNSLMRLFELFEPFNILYDNDFKKFNSIFGKFILSIDNNLVKRFNISISKRSKEYEQLCFNMNNYIKYILLDVSFIDNIENNDSFKITVYYNFFHNLKSIMEIILDDLTDNDPRHNIFLKIKKSLDKIIQKFKKLDKDKKYSIVLDTEKTKSGIFASNRFNVRKVGKEQIKKQRETIMKTTKQLFEKLNSKNKTNDFFKKFSEITENKDKKMLLLKKIKELLDELINEYNISFENLLKSDNLKNIIESFFEKINTNLNVNYSKDDVSKLIDSLLRADNDNNKIKFLKKQIFEPVIKQLVEKSITFGYKQVKFNILELLYIFAISFSSENQQLRNIKQQRENIKRVNKNVSKVLTGIKIENKQQKLALIVIEELKQKAKHLEGTHANPQQKQTELEKTLSTSMEKHKVSPNLLAITLLTVKPKMNTTSGKEFMKGIDKLLLTNSSTKLRTVLNNKPKPTSKNSNAVVVPNTSSYNSLTAQNKKSAVEKLKSEIKKGNVETKKKKINKVFAEINSNKPDNITTIDELRKEIITRLKPKVFKLTNEDETKLIQELSSGKNKTLTEAKLKEHLTKIIGIITEIKKDESIKSLNEFKNKVQEKLK